MVGDMKRSKVVQEDKHDEGHHVLSLWETGGKRESNRNETNLSVVDVTKFNGGYFTSTRQVAAND